MKKYALTLVVIVALLAVKVAFAQLITGGTSGGGGGGGTAGVTSLSGTSNQIDASAATGAVTLTLSSTAVMPGTLGVTTRTGTPASYATFNSSGVMVAGGPYVNPATLGTPCGRLTGTASTPVTSADVSTTTLFYVPYTCNTIPLWDGSTWVPATFVDTSFALSGLTNGTPYDLFGFLNGTTLNLESLIWTSATVRATNVQYTDGRLTKVGDKTRLLLGSFVVVNGGNTAVDGAASRFIANAYNTVTRPMQAALETTDSWTYNSTTVRQANANTANQLNFIVSYQGSAYAQVYAIATGGTNTAGAVGIGLDATTSFTNVAHGFNNPTANSSIANITNYTLLAAAGKHFLSWNEAAQSGHTITIQGDAGLASIYQSSISGWVNN